MGLVILLLIESLGDPPHPFIESLGDPPHESWDGDSHESLDDIIDCLIESLGLPSLFDINESLDCEKSLLLDDNTGDVIFLDIIDARFGRRLIKNSIIKKIIW